MQLARDGNKAFFLGHCNVLGGLQQLYQPTKACFISPFFSPIHLTKLIFVRLFKLQNAVIEVGQSQIQGLLKDLFNFWINLGLLTTVSLVIEKSSLTVTVAHHTASIQIVTVLMAGAGLTAYDAWTS